MMKKILSVLLTAAITLALSSTALAAGKEDKDVKIKAPKPVETRPGVSDSEIWTKPEESPVETVLTKLQAEDLALADAGIERSAVKSITAYKEYSHGAAYAYHVEFGVYDAGTRRTTVYVYQVDLATGELVQEHCAVH